MYLASFQLAENHSSSVRILYSTVNFGNLYIILEIMNVQPYYLPDALPCEYNNFYSNNR